MVLVSVPSGLWKVWAGFDRDSVNLQDFDGTLSRLFLVCNKQAVVDAGVLATVSFNEHPKCSSFNGFASGLDFNHRQDNPYMSLWALLR